MKKQILFPALITLSILSVQCTKDETSKKDEEITETKIFKDASNSDISFANKDIGFISSSINITTGTAMVAKTINGGETWKEISVYIDNDKSANIRSIYAKSIDSVYATYTTRNDRAGVCLSSDGGYTWKDIGNLSGIYSSHTYTGVYFRNAKQGFVSRGGGDILKTENGGIDWTVVHQHNTMGGAGRPFFINNLIGFAYGSFANDYGCSGTLLKTTDGGNLWIELRTLPECITNLNFTTPEIGYAFTFDNNVYKTTNGGGSWKLLTTFDGGLYFSSAIIGNTIYYATGTFIFKTTNDFASITKIYESIDNNAALSIKAISPNKNLLFILSNHSVIKIIKNK